MNILVKILLLGLLSFSLLACHHFKDTPFTHTRVVLSLKQPVNSENIDPLLNSISENIQIKRIELIRQSNNKQLIVNVYSCKNKDYWLTQLNHSDKINYAELDAKKTHK